MKQRTYVKFASRYNNVDHYLVTIDGEQHRIEFGPLGYRGVGREASKEEIAAIRDYLYQQEAEFQQWQLTRA